MFKHYLLLLLLALGIRPALAAQYYVAPAGLDTNSGTIAAPFLTIQRAQTAVAAGDTVYVRGGTYMMQNSQIALHFTSGTTTWSYVTNLTKSGTAGKRINYWAYPGEQPVFNYANLDPNANTASGERVNAFEVSGSYIYLRGLEVVGVRVPIVSGVNTQSICFSNNRGNNNIYERLSMHDGQAIGYYLTQGVNTLVLNCDAYRNNDNTSTFAGSANGGNVDGFGCHPATAGGTGNVFRGCRAWQNSDDGFDCINAYAAIVFENCWAFYNGYTPKFVHRGDGNGFKAGGYGTTAYTALPTAANTPQNTVRFCVSVRNYSNGFYANHHLAGNYWYDNTAYHNAVSTSSSNYNMVNRQDNTQTGSATDVPGYGHVLRNNVSYVPRNVGNDLTNYNAATCTIDHNTFTPNSIGITLSDNDFVSLDTTLLRSPRQADGSLPLLATLRPVANSGLVDAGINVGFPYVGSAPDVGAYEYANLWTGAVGTDWFASGNWSGGVPTAAADALVPVVSSARYPLLASGTATTRALVLGTGASLTMSGGTLNAQGDWTNNGTFAATGGTVSLGSPAAATLLGGIRTRFWNLTTNASGLLLGPTAGASVRRLLTLTGPLTTQGNALVLESDATGTALVVNSGGTVQGAATVQRYIDGSGNSGSGYRHYSAPVSNTTVADLTVPGGFVPVLTQSYNTSATPGLTTPFPTVFAYDQSRLASVTNNYSAFDKGFVVPLGTDALAPGRGYAVQIGAGQLVDFVGTLTTGDQPALALARNSGTTAADAGWALVGNPYPAPLDWSQVAAADRPGLDAAMYVVQSTGPYAANYRTYVNGQSTTSANNPFIASGQGFWVRVSLGSPSGSLTFRNSQRLTDYTNQPTFQRSTADLRPTLRLTLAGNSLADSWVAYAEAGATAGFEGAFDAAKLPNSTGLNLSSASGTGQLAIDGRPAFTAATVLPLAVGVPAAGSYTLTADALDNLPAGLTAYLRDAATGTTTALSPGSSYGFSVSAAQAAALLTGRFTVQFSATALAAAPALAASDVTLYPNPARAFTTVALPGIGGASAVRAELLNALGQVVLRQAVSLPASGTSFTLPTAGLAPGVYVLRLLAGPALLTKRLTVE